MLKIDTTPNNKIMTETYTETELFGKTGVELKAICANLNVRVTGKKTALIERILNPEEHQKKKKVKKEKKSSYYAQYYNGENHETAALIGNFLTENHSAKIKAGNKLEDDVAEDIKEHGINFYKGVRIKCPSIITPCVIASCRFTKSQYEQYGLSCKNKTCVEVDLVHIDDENTVTLIELKNGCNFDTKKSKGEVQSLEATKTLCENMGFVNTSSCIVCYDALEVSDTSLKTTMGQVKTMLYDEIAEKCGLNGADSRERINKKIQLRSKDNVKKLDDFIATYMALKN